MESPPPRLDHFYSEYSNLRELGEELIYDERRLIPISDDGGGGWYCFLTTSATSPLLDDDVYVYTPMDEPYLEESKGPFLEFILRAAK